MITVSSKDADTSAFVRIAVDVMGSDGGPGPLIAGVSAAVAADAGVHCTIVGTARALDDHLEGCSQERITTHVASEVISMAEDPAIAVRGKRDSSTVQAIQLARVGSVDAVVTAANTGAVVLAAGAVLRRLPGVLHPALATPLAFRTMTSKVLTDCGASTRREPAWLEQHAHLGVALFDALFRPDSVSVGLLANGIEAIKGDDVIREAHRRLEISELRYLGLVEPDAFFTREPDVIVTDGLMGNVLLKTIEATFRSLSPLLSQLQDRAAHPAPSLAGLDDLGSGAVLLGVDGLVIKTHGRGSAQGIARAIMLAARVVRSGLHARIRIAVEP